jgi:hypothetical protein
MDMVIEAKVQAGKRKKLIIIILEGIILMSGAWFCCGILSRLL